MPTKIATDSTTKLWWKETDLCQIPFPKAAAKGEIWTNMKDIFHEN